MTEFLDNIRVKLVSLPATVKGVTIEDEEGNYIVLINDVYNELTRWKTLRHEIEHIKGNHFSESDLISVCESLARISESKIKKSPVFKEDYQ